MTMEIRLSPPPAQALHRQPAEVARHKSFRTPQERAASGPRHTSSSARRCATPRLWPPPAAPRPSTGTSCSPRSTPGCAAARIDRIIDVFPPHQQAQVRVQLSTTLMGVCTQRGSSPTRDGRGASAPVEMLFPTPGVRNPSARARNPPGRSTPPCRPTARTAWQTMDAALAGTVRRAPSPSSSASGAPQGARLLQRLRPAGGSWGGRLPARRRERQQELHGDGRLLTGRDPRWRKGCHGHVHLQPRRREVAVDGEIEGESKTAAAAALRSRGYTVLDVNEVIDRPWPRRNIGSAFQRSSRRPHDLLAAGPRPAIVDSGLSMLAASTCSRSRRPTRRWRR